MQSIIDTLTQARYVDALTIQPGPWEGIDVSVSDVAAMMQVYELDHAGHFMGGDWRQEALVQPGTLSLGRVGGVRFRTNPATSGLPATIDAFAHAEGDPIIAGLQPRAQLPSIFGPLIGDYTISVPNGPNLAAVLATPIPGNWGSLLLRLNTAGGNWHYQAQWAHAGKAIVNFDFWTNFGAQSIAIPILGDSLILQARQNQGVPVDLTLQAYLTNFAPFSVWQRSEWTLLAVQGQQIPSNGSVDFALPLFAGGTTAQFVITNGGTWQIRVQGFNEDGDEISRPYQEQFAVANPLLEQRAFTLPPHRNHILFENFSATTDSQLWVTIIGDRT